MPEHDDTERLEFLLQFLQVATDPNGWTYATVRRYPLDAALDRASVPRGADILTIIDSAIDAQTQGNSDV